MRGSSRRECRIPHKGSWVSSGPDYLEVGYAWGCGVPVVILARQGEELHFDVQMHRCITYKNITHLAKELDRFLTDFAAEGS